HVHRPAEEVVQDPGHRQPDEERDVRAVERLRGRALVKGSDVERTSRPPGRGCIAVMAHTSPAGPGPNVPRDAVLSWPSHGTADRGEVRTRSHGRRRVMAVAGIDLSAIEFWALPLADRAAAFARLRAEPRPVFFEEPEVPFAERGPGYYALVKHADIVEASKHPAVFSSAQGATSIADLPAEFNEYFGSIINLDDPRHARLRRIVSRAFSPRLIAKFEDDVRDVATAVVDDLLATGPCDFVSNVAAKLPLKIICAMMGIPDEKYDMVLANTNIILSGADPSSCPRTWTRP